MLAGNKRPFPPEPSPHDEDPLNAPDPGLSTSEGEARDSGHRAMEGREPRPDPARARDRAPRIEGSDPDELDLFEPRFGAADAWSGVDADDRPDEDVRQAVWREFEASGLDSEAVDVHVRQGIVSLVGEASAPSIKQRLERIAASVRGVAEVENQLTVARFGARRATRRQDAEDED